MDFVKLLKNSIDTTKKKEESTSNTVRSKKNKENANDNTTNLEIYNDIKLGDYVKIVYLEGSQYNDYKGYIGEVKEYKKGKDYAIIMIVSTNVPKFIKISLKHFIKM